MHLSALRVWSNRMAGGLSDEVALKWITVRERGGQMTGLIADEWMDGHTHVFAFIVTLS